MAHHRDNFDFLLNGHRVEFKAASPTHSKKQSPFWQFALHRHSKLREHDVDYYVLCFESIPFTTANFYGAIQAPFGRKTIQYGMPELLKNAESLNRLFEEIVSR